jgi:hypothetical protein
LSQLEGNTSISDVSLTGSVRRVAGSDDESGSATLKALSSGAARADLSLSSGTRSELQSLSAASGTPTGNWSGPDGIAHPIAFQNLLSEPAWFFPAFAISRRLAAGYVATNVGIESIDGNSVDHISVCQSSSLPTSVGIPSIQHLTQVEFFLDPATLLPLAISFNTHPDDNVLLDIPVEIRFSDYKLINGVQVPFHIQKFFSGSLSLDVQVQNVVINSGLSASEFTIQ